MMMYTDVWRAYVVTHVEMRNEKPNRINGGCWCVRWSVSVWTLWVLGARATTQYLCLHHLVVGGLVVVVDYSVCGWCMDLRYKIYHIVQYIRL